MESARNQREVENRLRDALHVDRARVQTGKISRFGLMELSRQRLRPSLGESNHIPCPRCHGTGHIRGIESTALHILRIVQEESMKENTSAVQVQLPVEVATFLLNEKRADIHSVEQRMDVNVILIPNIHLETPNYTITRLRDGETGENDNVRSYELVEMPAESEEMPGSSQQQEAKPARQIAAVKGITPAQPAPIAAPEPVVAEKTGTSMFGRFKSWLGKITEKKAEVEEETKPETRRPRDNQQRRERGGRGRNNRNDNRTERGSEPRNDRGNSENAKPQAQEARPPREPREPRPPRAERPERQEREKPQALATQQPTSTEQPATEGGEQRSRRGRGGRGNRGDRPPREQRPSPDNVEVVDPAAEVVSAPAAVAEAPIVVETPAPTPVAIETPASAPVAVEPEAVVEVPAQQAPVQQAIEGVEEAPTAAAVAEKPERKPRQPRRRKTPEPVVVADLSAVGLEMVETRADAVKAAPVVEEEPAPRAPAKPAAWQQKKAEEEAAAEPLVMVETQK
jgi:ribonuclease E